MNCLEREKLFSFAHQMLEPTEAEEVHWHLTQCARCGQAVEEYRKLDSVLDDWVAPEPSPWFDVRVRARVEASEKEGSWLMGFGRLRVLAMSVLSVILIVAGFITFREHRTQEASTPVASQSVPQEGQTARPAAGAAEARLKPLPAEQQLKMDENLSVLEDYDMLANFEVLSELPQAKNN
jgi:hypothetical protein